MKEIKGDPNKWTDDLCYLREDSIFLFLLFSEKWSCGRATILLLSDVPWKMKATRERCKGLVVGALKGFIHMVKREAA